MGMVKSVGIGFGLFLDPELKELIADPPSDPLVMFNGMMTVLTSSLWVIIPMLYSNVFLMICPIV